MKNEFVPYDIALAMKELGFDEPCFGFYSLHDDNKVVGGNYPCNGTNSVPLYQQAFRWFRENYYGLVSVRNELHKPLEILSNQTEKDACLRKLIEIVNQNKDENN